MSVFKEALLVTITIVVASLVNGAAALAIVFSVPFWSVASLFFVAVELVLFLFDQVYKSVERKREKELL